MFNKLFGKKSTPAAPVTDLKAFVSGEAITLTDVNDGVFSAGVLGEGMAIRPTTETLTAPCDGEICTVADTNHAVGIQLDNGLQLLLHIGLETVGMEGKGFTVHVKNGQKVSCGQKLVTFSRDAIKAAGCADTVVMVVTENEKDIPLNFQCSGAVTAPSSTVVTFG